MEKLTDFQQKTIEDSIWIVNTVLQKLGLNCCPDTEDLRQTAILHMCKVIRRFDPDRNIKWETFAYTCIYRFIKTKHIRETRKRMHEIKCEEIYTPQSMQMPLEEMECAERNKHKVAQLMSVCTPKERLYLDLKMQGYTRKEIEQLMGVPQGYVRKCHEEIKRKAQVLSLQEREL